MDIFESTAVVAPFQAVFREQKLSQYDLQRILETTSWAPSPFNSQPWEFIIVQEDKHLQEIARLVAPAIVCHDGTLSLDQRRDYLAHLPNLLFCLEDTTRQDPGDNAYKLGLISMGTSSANLFLAASADGIGLQPFCTDNNKREPMVKLKRYLKIPEKLEIRCFFGLGYLKDKKVLTKNKKPQPLVIHDNYYGNRRQIEKLTPNPIDHNAFSLIKKRRSYRKDFLKRDIDPRDEDNLVKAAKNSFSFCDARTWELIFVKDKGLINAFADLLYEVSCHIHLDQGYSKRMKTWMRYSQEEKVTKADGILIVFWNKFLGYSLKKATKVIDKVKPLRELSVKRFSKDSFADMLRQAPLMIVIMYNKKLLASSGVSYELNLMSLGVVIQNILLAATARNIGAQFQSIFLDTEEGLQRVRHLLRLPDEIEAIEVLRLGYIDPQAPNKLLSISSNIRRPFEKIVHQEFFQPLP